MNATRHAPVTSLREAFDENGQGHASDKWSSYFEKYEQVLAPFRDKPLRLLEVGIQNGGSLDTWAKYFARAESIVGVDIDPKCASLSFVDPRISVVIGDAGDAATEAEILRHSPQFDIIIDDGSHRSRDVVRAFARYFPHLSDGGVYIVEDLHASYWRSHDGGLFHPLSSMALFKTLADLLNAEHWRCAVNAADVLARFGTEHDCSFDGFPFGTLHQVTFWNSLCAIKRASESMNRLGTRTIKEGAQEVARLNVSGVYHPDQASNPWSQISAFPISLAGLSHESGVLQVECRHLRAENERLLAERNQAIERLAEIKQSFSWRATRPLRHMLTWISSAIHK